MTIVEPKAAATPLTTDNQLAEPGRRSRGFVFPKPDSAEPETKPYGVTSFERHFDADARSTNTDLRNDTDRISASTLTAHARADFPRIVLEQRELPGGSYVVHRDATDHGVHYIAWDPAQITREKIEIYINIYIAGSRQYVEYTPEVGRALRGFEKIRRADPDPKTLEFFDAVEQAVIAADDPKAAVLRIADLLAAEQLAEFIAQHDGQLLTRPPEKGFFAWTARVDGRLTVVVPEGYDPARVLPVVREMVARQDGAK